MTIGIERHRDRESMKLIMDTLGLGQCFHFLSNFPVDLKFPMRRNFTTENS